MNYNWSQHDALMYGALRDFPENLKEKFLDANDFRSHFTDFYGRPVQDIVEALHLYGKDGYFKAEIMLPVEYLEQGKTLDRVTIALNRLHPDTPDLPDKHRDLGKLVYAKVKTKQPLSVTEVRNLPDEAKPYLVFKLLDIDKQRLRNELAIYDANASQPHRLEKSKTIEPVSRIAHVFMDGRSINIMIADRIYTIAKLSRDGSHYNFMRYLTDPNNSDFAISNEEISHIDSCKNIKDITELIRHCGFDLSLKKAFFSKKKDKLNFWATANLDAKQYSAVKKRALTVENKS